MQPQQPTFSKTRIAPTPSGYLHLGNVLSFGLTAALAHKTGAKILLRIDDLDQQRIRTEYIQDIFDTLNFMEIPWHEGPQNIREYKTEWSQMYRLESYQQALKRLRLQGDLFACNCTRSTKQPCTCATNRLPFDEPECSWKLRTADSNIIMQTYPDEIVTTKLPADVQNFIVRKKDDLPTYQLASVVDDLLFNIDLVVRGQDLWPSTLAQLQLAKKLRFDPFLNATFHHHALLMASGNQKLSKSAGDTSVKYLRESGRTAAEIYSMIATLCGMNEVVNNWQQLTNALAFDHSRKGT
jgi:glutamyl/glutaminyl-tRNA synthetase